MHTEQVCKKWKNENNVVVLEYIRHKYRYIYRYHNDSYSLLLGKRKL